MIMKRLRWMRPHQHRNSHVFRLYDLEEDRRSRISSGMVWAVASRCGWFTISDLEEDTLRANRCRSCTRAVRWYWLKEAVLEIGRFVRWWTWLKWSRP